MSIGIPDWLPPLLLLEDYDGDWQRYLAALHARYRADFGGQRPQFRGVRMSLKRHPLINEMEATFWHFISTGSGEDNRVPDLRRCERIAWPLAIMMAVDTERVRTWEEESHRGRKVLIALPDFDYLVVVDDRGEYVLPWTAYCVEYTHSQRKLRQKYERYWQERGQSPKS